MNHLLSIEDLDRATIERICDRAASFSDVEERWTRRPSGVARLMAPLTGGH